MLIGACVYVEAEAAWHPWEVFQTQIMEVSAIYISKEYNKGQEDYFWLTAKATEEYGNVITYRISPNLSVDTAATILEDIMSKFAAGAALVRVDRLCYDRVSQAIIAYNRDRRIARQQAEQAEAEQDRRLASMQIP